MSEISEATQIVALAGNMIVTGLKGFYRLTELGIALAKAIKVHAEKRMHEKLFGEVSLEQLTRFEGNKLSTARFEEISIEQLKPVLDSYGIPYVVMPSSEVNGVKYTSITFGNTYTDRMAAVIQDFAGKGTIVRENSVPKYITSGEVSLDVLQEQDGPQLMVYQFPEDAMEKILPVLNKSGLKYAVLPDLNLGDGQSEVAFPASQREMIQKTMERLANGQILSMQQYYENADPKDVTDLADEYDQTHQSRTEREEAGAKRLTLDKTDWYEEDGKLYVAVPELNYDVEVKPDSIYERDEEHLTLGILPGENLKTYMRRKGEPKAEKKEADLTEGSIPAAEIRGDDMLADISAMLESRKNAILKSKERQEKEVSLSGPSL